MLLSNTTRDAGGAKTRDISASLSGRLPFLPPSAAGNMSTQHREHPPPLLISPDNKTISLKIL